METKRAVPRFPKRILIRYGPGHTDWVGFTKDVSGRGFRIECRRIVPAGSCIHLRFGDEPRVYTVRVIWTQRAHPAMHAVGCFSNMGVCFEAHVEAMKQAA
jgi:hypothetical protein